MAGHVEILKRRWW